MGWRNSQGSHQFGSVRGKLGNTVGAFGLVGFAMTAHIVGDHLIVPGEERDLGFPVAVAGSQSVDKKQRIAGSGDLIIDIDITATEDRHGCLSLGHGLAGEFDFSVPRQFTSINWAQGEWKGSIVKSTFEQ